MTETEIKQMLAQGERLTLECKKAKTELPKIVMPKLTFDLPHPFHMEGYQRVDDTPQMKAGREGFTNSIIHSDLFFNSSLKFEYMAMRP